MLVMLVMILEKVIKFEIFEDLEGISASRGSHFLFDQKEPCGETGCQNHLTS